jgi:hypothetical protein
MRPAIGSTLTNQAPRRKVAVPPRRQSRLPSEFVQAPMSVQYDRRLKQKGCGWLISIV